MQRTVADLVEAQADGPGDALVPVQLGLVAAVVTPVGERGGVPDRVGQRLPLGRGEAHGGGTEVGRGERDEQLARGARRAVHAGAAADELAHHSDAAVDGEGAGRRGELAGDEPEQRRLADAVGPDEGDPLTVADREADVPEQLPATGKSPADVADLDRAHGPDARARPAAACARVSASRSTSRSGRPRARAAATASSCSGLARPSATLTRISCPSSSIVVSARRCGHRSIVVARRPRLPVSASMRAARRSASAGSASAATVWAGRPFFITIGVAHASWAPAASSAATVWASTSPVTSSTFTSNATAEPAGSGRRRLRGRGSDEHLDHVRAAGRVGVAGAVARGLHRHRRHRAERVGERGEDGHPGRGRELHRRVDADDRHATAGEHPGDCRWGVGQLAVGGLDRAVAHRQRRSDDAVDAEGVQGRADADDVDDGVGRADLVELHIVGRDTVDGALGFGELGEDTVGALAHPVGERGVGEQLPDGPHRSVLVPVRGVGDDGLGRGDPAPLGALERQRVAVQAEAVERRGDLGGVGAGVDQRAEQHVAGHPRGAVDVDDAGSHGSISPMRATERQRGSGCPRPAWPGNAMNVIASGPLHTPRRSRCRCRPRSRRSRTRRASPAAR